MPKFNWINFVHIYQPPYQETGIICQVADQSYDYIFTLSKKYPRLHWTVNINGSLLAQLAILRPNILKNLQQLEKRGRIELTGSAQHHPILPLISPAQAKRQILLNRATIKKYFPQAKISGFYFPEMAYSVAMARLVRSLGYGWTILDPISSSKGLGQGAYLDQNTGLKIVIRNTQASQAYPPEYIYRQFLSELGSDLITATDGEIYGHWHEDWQGYIDKVSLDKNWQILNMSQYLASQPRLRKIKLNTSSASDYLDSKQALAMWNDKKNKIHRQLWSLANYAEKIIAKYANDVDIKYAQENLDQGLSSCAWWWSAGKKPSPFSPLTWHPDLVLRGGQELVRAVRSIKQARPKEKIIAERQYLKLQELIWQKHWLKYNIYEGHN